jgi:hypothetical protein
MRGGLRRVGGVNDTRASVTGLATTVAMNERGMALIGCPMPGKPPHFVKQVDASEHNFSVFSSQHDCSWAQGSEFISMVLAAIGNGEA